MEIPILFAKPKGIGIRIGRADFVDGMPIMSEETRPLAKTVADRDSERKPVVVFDVCGFTKKHMTESLLRRIKIPGKDIWFATYVDCAEDVMDAFLGNISGLLVPYHTVRSPSVLKDVYEISESCIPLVFVSNGGAVCRNGSRKTVSEAVGELSDIGYARYAVMDLDGSMGQDGWDDLKEMFPGIIPYVHLGDAPCGFDTVIRNNSV